MAKNSIWYLFFCFLAFWFCLEPGNHEEEAKDIFVQTIKLTQNFYLNYKKN